MSFSGRGYSDNNNQDQGTRRGGGRGRGYNSPHNRGYGQRGRYHRRYGTDRGHSNNYNRRGYSNNNNNRYRSHPFHANNTPNDLQVNAFRFAREPASTDSTRGRGYRSRREYKNNYAHHHNNKENQPMRYPISPDFDHFAFPNDWDHDNIHDVKPYYNFPGWKATKPKVRYYTSDSHIYPDRVGVPQICCKGDIDDIIKTGCNFASEHYELHPSLLPSSITLMVFDPQNSNFLNQTQQQQHIGHDGSQIRLKYSWSTFFKILWVNAEKNKNDEDHNFGVEIPELGWKLAAIEKFEHSMQRWVAPNIQIAFDRGYIEQDTYQELIHFFKGLNPDFHVTSKNDQDHNKQRYNKKVEIVSASKEPVDDDEDKQNDVDYDDEEDLIRNATEATEFFAKNKFVLSSTEPRFFKKIREKITPNYLKTVLPKELKHICNTAKRLSDLLSYEWRIGMQLGDDPSIYIEFWSRQQNQFDVWAQLKQKLNIDKEGDDNRYDPIEIGKECAREFFKLMKDVYTTQKVELLASQNEQEYAKNKQLLKELNNCIPILYLPPKSRDGPSVRPSKFKNNWWDCCCEYNYPGKEILDEIIPNTLGKDMDDMDTKENDQCGDDDDDDDDEGDIKDDIDELTKQMEQHTIQPDNNINDVGTKHTASKPI